MKFKVTGSGEPLVLVHGALTDLRMWHAIEPYLAASHRVFSITQRYFFDGEPGNGKPFGYETHARDLIVFLKEEVKLPAHIVAWSYGADVVLLAAKFAPETLRSAFLYELGRHTHLTGDPLDAYFKDASIMFGGLGQTISDHGVTVGTEQLVDASACQEGFFQNQPAMDKAIQLDNASTLPLQLEQVPSQDISCSDIQLLSFPICFARGMLTRDIFRLATDGAYQCSSNGALSVIEGASHMLPIEDPGQFAEAVNAFLNGMDKS
jgi:pimeloyl-ACP methyl ester carboxylesterase